MNEEKSPQWIKWVMRVLIVVLVAGSFFGGCSYLNRKANLEDENIIEEFLEAQLEQQTGLSLDFTPLTPEE